MLNDKLPKIGNDFSDLTADSLQQAWRGETKQQRWRRAYRSLTIFINYYDWSSANDYLANHASKF